MPNALIALLMHPATYAVVGLGAWAGRIWIKKLVESQVDHQFAVQLATHKHGLQIAAEQAKFELQRQLTSASLYLHKKHTAAAEVYTAVRVAHGAVGQLFGVQPGFNFDDCNEADLRQFMTSWEFLGGTQDRVIAAWRGNKPNGIALLKNEVLALRIPTADNKMQIARNLMYANEIYFSDEAIKALDGFVEVANDWLAHAHFPPQRGEPIHTVSREELNKALERVQVSLRSEVGGTEANAHTVTLLKTSTEPSK